MGSLRARRVVLDNQRCVNDHEHRPPSRVLAWAELCLWLFGRLRSAKRGKAHVLKPANKVKVFFV